MKRRESRRRETGDDQRLAVAALSALSREWIPPRRSRRKRTGAGSKLRRLAAETRELLALWTYYRLACLDAMDTGHLGAA
jgi:hypothetical protein